MEEEKKAEEGLTRRSIAKGAAWSVPAVTIAAAAPARAASGECPPLNIAMPITQGAAQDNAGGDASPNFIAFQNTSDTTIKAGMTITVYNIKQARTRNDGDQPRFDDPVPTIDDLYTTLGDINSNPNENLAPYDNPISGESLTVGETTTVEYSNHDIDPDVPEGWHLFKRLTPVTMTTVNDIPPGQMVAIIETNGRGLDIKAQTIQLTNSGTPGDCGATSVTIDGTSLGNMVL